MKKPLDNKARYFVWIGTSGFLLVGLLTLAGCGGPPAPPGARPGMAPPGVSMPGGGPPGVSKPLMSKAAPVKPGVKPGNVQVSGVKPPLLGNVPDKPAVGQSGNGSGAVNPLGPASKVERAGNTVDLASEIIIAGTNPFLDRLPRPEVVEVVDPESGEPQQAALPLPEDPFENVTLLGIAYSAKAPMALISIAGGENQSQMVRKGDILMLDGGQVKVSTISQDSIEMERMGTGGEKRTFNLPSIIGYGSTSSTSGADSTAPADKAGSLAPSGSGSAGTRPRSSRPTSQDGQQSNFPNLGKLSEASSPKTKNKTPDVVLKEL